MITSFTTSFGTINEKPTLIVKLETNNGLVGYGESAALPFPFYKPETTDISILVFKNYIAPLVLNKEFKTIDQLMEFLKPSRYLPTLRAKSLIYDSSSACFVPSSPYNRE